MSEPEPVESTVASVVRPAQVLIAAPPLARCLARSVYGAPAPGPPSPREDQDDLEPFRHLVPAGSHTHADTLSTRELDLVRGDAARLRRLVGDAHHARHAGSATVVYRLESEDHRQTGVVVECPIDDYRQGRIRRHEATSPSRVRLLADYLAAAESELVPVTLVHRARARLQSLLDEATAAEPYAVLRSPDGLTEAVWLVEPGELTGRVWQELDALDHVYIADGHHRMDAAARLAGRRTVGRPAASAHVLCALFPSDEARVLGYHRCVVSPRISTDLVLEAVRRHPMTLGLSECADAEAADTSRGVVAVFVEGRWFRLSLRSPDDDSDPRAGLDVVVLEDRIIPAALDAADASSDAEVTALPGNIGRAEFARWCEEHRAVGFLIHPPTVDQIMAVADAGAVMPAKSTWFDPKARAGLFVRDLLSDAAR